MAAGPTLANAGSENGLQVPALVVKETPDAVGDTYPHRKSGNMVVTIHQFFTGALAALEHAA